MSSFCQHLTVPRGTSYTILDETHVLIETDGGLLIFDLRDTRLAHAAFHPFQTYATTRLELPIVQSGLKPEDVWCSISHDPLATSDEGLFHPSADHRLFSITLSSRAPRRIPLFHIHVLADTLASLASENYIPPTPSPRPDHEEPNIGTVKPVVSLTYDISWEEWGPKHALLTACDSDITRTAYSIAESRSVSLTTPVHGHPRLTITDFHPHRVRAAIAGEHEERSALPFTKINVQLPEGLLGDVFGGASVSMLGDGILLHVRDAMIRPIHLLSNAHSNLQTARETHVLTI
ncbi:hypothetical protein OF83DRAFT_439521 [Amylostereum chailletii]|nr:hypothetical protein OF83DRAFT_439521 [Amylostereum chailletii]